jgi:hypothetical protein
VGQPLHLPPGRPTTILEPGPAARATGLGVADQPTELSDRVLQHVGVGRVVDVGLDHRGVHPQLAAQQLVAHGDLPRQALVAQPVAVVEMQLQQGVDRHRRATQAAENSARHGAMERASSR